LDGLSKRFGWNWALRDASARVEKGTTLCLVGPNGAGKTTLLKLVATLLRPSAGDAMVAGRSIRRAPDEIRRRTGLLTAQGYLYDDLTADENLYFTARMAGLRAKRGEAGEVLERVGLSSVADQRVRTFSTGMRKRLALAQLLIRPLELALLDEPYAGLDAQGIALVDEVVREYRAAGTTVVVASHQDGEAVRAAELKGVLRGGRLQLLRNSESLAEHLSTGSPGGTGAEGAVPEPEEL
jgi:heme exporter protein A